MKPQHLLVWLLLLISVGQALAQASLVKDIFPLGNSGVDFTLSGAPIGNKLLFAADNSVNGKELWISDGTDAGTTMLKDIIPGSRNASSNPSAFFTMRGFVYFYIRPSTTGTFELWRSDGTANGTIKVGDQETVNGSFFEIDTTLYCITSNNGLIIKDANKSGFRTILSRSTNTDLRNFPTSLSKIGRFGTNWLFTAYSNQAQKESIFLSDGTSAGTRRIAPLQSSAGHMAITHDQRQAFFVDDDGSFGAELWVTDGTTAGTKMVRNIAPGGLSSMNANSEQIMRPLRNGALFIANDGVTGNELWISDGTDAGTKLFKEFTPGSGGTTFRFIDLGDNLVYFTAGSELWRTDGTDIGTFSLAKTGTYLSIQKEGNFIYYVDINSQVIRLNGQVSSSSQIVGKLTNIILNFLFSTRTGIVLVGNNIFYSGLTDAITDATGVELWKLPFCDHQATISAPVGASFCTGASIDLQASGSGGAGPFTYKWTTGSSNLGTNAKLTVDKTGTYAVDVTDSKGCTVSTSVYAAESRNLPVGINGPTAYCAGETVPFSSTVAGGTAPYSYQWRQSNSSIAGQTSTTLSVNTTGFYSLSVIDSKGCTGTSAGVSVSQKASPSATITASGPTVVQPGSSLSVILTTPAATGQTYQWSRDGQPIAGATNNTYLATGAGDYTVFVNRDGCTATSSVTRLAVGLAVGITGQANFCIGSSTTLVVAATTGTAPYTYQWRLGNAIVGNGASIVVSTAGSYSVTVTDSRNVVGTLPAVVVTQRPIPDATISANGALVLQPGATVALNAPNVAGQTYQWFRSGTVIPGVTGNQYTANTAGDYTVTVTRDGCSATSVPTRVSLALQAVISGANQLCTGQSTTLVAGNTNGEAPFTYRWSVNGVQNNNLITSAIVVNTPGSYVATITDKNNLIGVSPTFSVTQKPAPNTSISTVGQLPLQPGTSAVLSVVAVPSQTYQWSRDGAVISGATGSSYTVTQAGNYAITIVRDGCTGTSSSPVSVALILSAEPVSEGITLTVSPNPTDGQIRAVLMLEVPAPATLRLTDGMGRSLQSWQFDRPALRHEQRLDISNAPSGLYFLQAEAGEKKVVSKIVKQ